MNARIGSILLQPCESIDKSLHQEYTKGEVAGIKLFVSLPETIIDDLTDQLEEMKNGQNSTGN